MKYPASVESECSLQCSQETDNTAVNVVIHFEDYFDVHVQFGTRKCQQNGSSLNEKSGESLQSVLNFYVVTEG